MPCKIDGKENDSGFLLLLRSLVILLNIPSPGLFDRIKRTAANKRGKAHVRHRMPFQNSLLFILRHVLEFVAIAKRHNKLHEETPMAVTFPTMEKVMKDLADYASHITRNNSP